MNYNIPISCELYCIIVNNGLGSKVVKIAKENDIKGATILIGRGTINNTILNFLGISEERKEIVLMGANRHTGDAALLEINNKMNLHKPNRGIGFSISISQIIGSKLINSNLIKEEENKMNYNLIITIVDRGSAESVIDAATHAGSRGGTILNGRGSGIHETQKLFNIEIEPEKEVVLILAKHEVTEGITDAIRKELKIDDPGKGIIFVLDVTQAYGLYEGK